MSDHKQRLPEVGAKPDAKTEALRAAMGGTEQAQPAQAVPKTVKFSTKGCNPEDLFDFSAWVPLLSDAEMGEIVNANWGVGVSQMARAIEQAVRAKLGKAVPGMTSLPEKKT